MTYLLLNFKNLRKSRYKKINTLSFTYQKLYNVKSTLKDFTFKLTHIVNLFALKCTKFKFIIFSLHYTSQIHAITRKINISNLQTL